MILGSELELIKVQTTVSKHLAILPKIRGGGNSTKFGSNQPIQKESLSSWFIGFCEVSVFCLSGYLSAWLSTASSKLYIL